MRQFLLISAIICALTFSAYGCGKAPDTQNATIDQSPGDIEKTASPEIDKTEETVKQTEQKARQVIADTTETAGDAVESAAEEAMEKIETAGEVLSEAAPPVSTNTPQESGTVPDVIEMKNTDAFSTHVRGIVMFGHKKHTASAPDGYGIACGECHHDQDGQPLDLKEGDPVQGCLTCHDKTDKPKKPAGLSVEEWKAMQLEYYYGAIHANCIDCHKAGQAGPVKCAECHPNPEE